MTKSHIATLAAFVALGCFAAWQWTRIRELQEANAALEKQVAAASAAPRPVAGPPGGGRRRPGGPNAQETPEVAVRAEAPPGQANNQNDPERAAREARFREMRESERALRIESRLLALKTKLNLTPEQETAVRAAMEKANAEREALRQASAGLREEWAKLSDEERDARHREEVAKFAAVDAAQEAEITALMSEEQLAAYEQYKSEQKQTEVENRANMQLGQLQSMLSLTEEQKDAAFQYFAQQAQTFDPREIMAQGGDPREFFEEQQKAQLEAMRQILTPEQFELYSKQEEQRANMFRNGGGRGGFGPPGGRGFGPPPPGGP